jgi:hypothetical protein
MIYSPPGGSSWSTIRSTSPIHSSRVAESASTTGDVARSRAQAVEVVVARICSGAIDDSVVKARPDVAFLEVLVFEG